MPAFLRIIYIYQELQGKNSRIMLTSDDWMSLLRCKTRQIKRNVTFLSKNIDLSTFKYEKHRLVE